MSDIQNFTAAYYMHINALRGFGEEDFEIIIGKPTHYLVFETHFWKIVNGKSMKVIYEGPYSEVLKVSLERFLISKVPFMMLTSARTIITSAGTNDILNTYHYRLPIPTKKHMNGKHMTEFLDGFIRDLKTQTPKQEITLNSVIPGFEGNPLTIASEYLGGYGFSNKIIPGAEVLVTFTETGVDINSEIHIWNELLDISVSGPGLYQTGGGWFGGGIGVKGALEGAAFASIMNTISTKTHISTVIRMIFLNSEINIHTSALTPAALDIKLSPLRAYLATRSNPPTSLKTVGQTGQKTFCTQCGVPREISMKFCGNCGSELK